MALDKYSQISPQKQVRLFLRSTTFQSSLINCVVRDMKKTWIAVLARGHKQKHSAKPT